MAGRDTGFDRDVLPAPWQEGLSYLPRLCKKAASGILNRKSTLPPLPLLNLPSFAHLPWKALGDTTSLPSEPVTESCCPVA